VGKYWINKRVVNVVYEAMEAHGGAGYIEESVMPRLYRQSPLNSIWEGSGNVICLDILRALGGGGSSGKSDARDALVAELAGARGGHRALDRAIDDLEDRMARPAEEGDARRLAEAMAIALQGAVLMKTAPNFVSDAFCALRLAERPAFCYGAFDGKIDIDAVLGRAAPEV
jgi:putative acyl-CoA dehydrogenase